MTEWVELKTLQEVASAQARGDEIEVGHKYDDIIYWKLWGGLEWTKCYKYRSRPRKQTKTVVVREYLWVDRILPNNVYHYQWTSADMSKEKYFVHWTGNERTEEVTL